MTIARLLAERDLPLTPDERTRNGEAAACTGRDAVADAHAALFQADGGRRDRKRAVLLPHHLPARTAGAVRRHRRRVRRPSSRSELRQRKLPPFVQMGSWIGGDRDGNPNVNAGTMQHALVRQSTTILDFYLQEVHTLGAELSISTLLVGVSPELQALADASPDHVAAPQRRAVPACADRHVRQAPPARARWARPTSCARKSAMPNPTQAPSNSRPTCKPLSTR
jgi:phosphoenolpyruvate carboxylase